ncbi:MAG: hypothetical protein KME28_10980 [Pelatocladus maniniholoensis HA4357-MV3]|uniref:Uncharacterized protein n=1 Tax=Pelatocladus maniniholoensis HA4357-MV3 TaxID=1117104 RepID=A0A9E3H8N7_9NOST|nr:hypothetical protein [Pelatocladus maniniholoensis HA4357-MV3]
MVELFWLTSPLLVSDKPLPSGTTIIAWQVGNLQALEEFEIQMINDQLLLYKRVDARKSGFS